ncbi:centrosome-associated protein 350-like [Sabethes cyaneus]|uniref:centrosome-associated protein 350-like n=1 Tax=Sabethes cyaneus TaxID=53552 RepID=UPI00237EE724|nr:centrosome-associated protein 350-like [Sabethes cyaneus]
MSTDSESRSGAEKHSHNSATYSIHSLEDVPIRKSAVQIIRERSSEHLQLGSPRKKNTVQITKLVLKDRPTSPRRKITPMVIKSITTFTSSALTGNEEKTYDRNINQPQEEYTIKPLPKAERLIAEFEDKKNERNQVSSEFQNFLLENLNVQNRNNIETPKSINSGSDNSKKLVEINSDVIVTSNSDPHSGAVSSSTSELKSRKESVEKSSSASTEQSTDKMPAPPPTGNIRKPAPRPKSMDSKRPPTEEPKKEKSYDPQKAREFIEKQQAKRKQEKKSSAPQTAEKDIIRKRLEELRKNSRMLVSKNVQKGRKRSLSEAPPSSAGSKQPLGSISRGPLKTPPTKPLRKSSSVSSLQVPSSSQGSATQCKKSDVSESNKTGKRSSLLLKPNLSEKMGIMRKPDEVALLDVLTSPLRSKTPPVNVERKSPEKENEIAIDRSNHEITIDTVEQQLKLEVPAVTLRSDLSLQPPTKITNEKKESKVTPAWLKHTLLQPDPYPFIIAVRKKLEAIRNLNREPYIQLEESVIPKQQTKVPIPCKQSNSTNSQKCLAYLESLKSVPYIHKLSVEGSKSDQHISSVYQQSESNTTSEISSIKSDFVLPLPPLSSTKLDLPEPSIAAAQNVDKCHHKPNIAPISPLSVDRISNLKITGDNLQPLERSINFHRGTDMPDADLIPDRMSFTSRYVQEDLEQSKLSANTSEKQRNFVRDSARKRDKSPRELQSCEKALEAFNRSLAQVIQVNQKLYSALQKPPAPITVGDRIKIRDEMTQTTPVPSVPNASTINSNYSEDFERSEVQKTLTNVSTSAKGTSEEISPSSSNRSTTTSSNSTTSNTAESSPSKTGNSDSHTSLETRSLNYSDSHHTNAPPPEEYLPSFEESLHRHSKDHAAQDQGSTPKTTAEDTSSIETQISDETIDKQQTLRHTLDASKSLLSININILEEGSEKQNGIAAFSDDAKESKIEFLKAPSSTGASTGGSSSSVAEAPLNDTTMGSDILAMFNRTDLEISVLSTTVSETNLSYSSIGLYDQLIQSEKSKSEQLATRVRLKEKALLDRTKGQLAWLELQKQRYREKGGMSEQISAIKKKQRAILVRLERERAGLNKFHKHSLDTSRTRNSARSPITPKSMDKLNSFSSNSRTISLRKSGGGGSGLTEISPASNPSSILASLQQHQRKMTTLVTTSVISNSSHLQLSTAAVRGVELEPNESLEDMLARREQELKNRRQHVQALLEWHQKLEREEQKILEIERNLLQYNRTKTNQKSTAPAAEQRVALGRIRSIEQSLQTLQQIGVEGSGNGEEEQVEATGSKLNRLWYRLTGFKENRYEPQRSYTLTRANLEMLYEQAKTRVLERFSNDREMKTLLEQSFGGLNSSGTSATTKDSNVLVYKNSGEEQEMGANTSGDSSSFRTTINSITEKEPESIALSKNSGEVDEKIEEKSSLLDVDEIISRVSDITENINGFLSSTTNIDELLRNEQEKQGSCSVEFHTIEEESDSGKREKSSPEGYSSTFDAPTIEEQEHVPPVEEEGQLIEDTSLPQFCASIADETIAQSETDSTNKLTEDIQDETSLEEASSTSSAASTFTTSEDPGEAAQLKEENSLPKSPLAVELEKRLISLHVDLEDFSDSLERVSAMRSPEAARQSSSESERGNCSFVEREDYSTDKESTNETIEKPFPDESQTMRSASKAATTGEAPGGGDAHRVDVKIRNKNVNENFPHTASSSSVSPVAGTSILSYLAPQTLHNATNATLPITTTTASSIVPNRMPDIINEAEVLRRQQLQIEQEIKQLEQQVVLFREIPNKPPPPYIPPANGSPLALIFPSETRIDELIESRTNELYQNDAPLEKLRSDHVTNIYEKLVLDMCKELYTDLRPPSPDVSFRTVQHDKRPLAFYNPPNSLRCMQDHMKRKVKRILNEESLLQHQQQQQNLHHCPMPFLMFNGGNGGPHVGGIGGGSAKRKRDQVDEILAQEMFDEEARWTNFDREEIEVKERIVGELTKMLVAEAVRDMEAAWLEKHDDQLAVQTADVTTVEEKPLQRTEEEFDL